MTNDTELCSFPISQLSRLIASQQVSPVEVVQEMLERIDRLEPVLNCYVTVLADRALAAARKAETELEAGDCPGPLHGIPIALKDIIDVAGCPTTASSKILAGRLAERNSESSGGSSGRARSSSARPTCTSSRWA